MHFQARISPSLHIGFSGNVNWDGWLAAYHLKLVALSYDSEDEWCSKIPQIESFGAELFSPWGTEMKKGLQLGKVRRPRPQVYLSLRCVKMKTSYILYPFLLDIQWVTCKMVE